VAFNVQRAITDLAEEIGIADVVQDWFNDPEFQRKMMIMMSMGPGDSGKAGSVQTTMAGQMQNGGLPTARNIASPQEEMNQNAQAGANEAQSINQGVY